MAEDYNPLDTGQQEAAQTEQDELRRLQRDREVDDFKWLMGHRQGRRVMWRLLSMTGLYRNPHVPGAPSEETAFRCGEQNIGQRLMAEIHEITPDSYNVMVKEFQEWQKQMQARHQ